MSAPMTTFITAAAAAQRLSEALGTGRNWSIFLTEDRRLRTGRSKIPYRKEKDHRVWYEEHVIEHFIIAWRTRHRKKSTASRGTAPAVMSEPSSWWITVRTCDGKPYLEMFDFRSGLIGISEAEDMLRQLKDAIADAHLHTLLSTIAA